MTLDEYLRRTPYGTAARLKRTARVGLTTLWRARNGSPVSYAIAQRISLATGGAVSIPELCDPRPRMGAADEIQSNEERATGLAEERKRVA